MLVEKFKKDRRQSTTVREGERSPSTVNKELQCLSKIFNMAIDSNYAESNPCRKVKKLRGEGQRNRYLLPDEETRLMAALTEHRAYLRPIIALALNTGMRRGELLGLKWSCVDFQRDVIYVMRTKTDKRRSVPINAKVKEELAALRSSAPDSEYVFTNPRTGARLIEIKRSFVTACRDAGIEDFHFHDCRHTAATRMADGGVDAFTIAEILGHATLHMTKRYTHALDQNKRRAVESLNGYAENNCLNFVSNEKRQAI
jgi:integrase